MSRSKPHRPRWTRLGLIVSAAVVALIPRARAQQPAGHHLTAAHPIYRIDAPRMQQMRVYRPSSPRSILQYPTSAAHPRVVRIPRPVIRQLPQPGPVTTYIASRVTPPSFAPRGVHAAALQPRSDWGGLGPWRYSNSYLFGGAFVSDFGYWEPPANYQMLPLGFGLWPACDSGTIPGRFWTIGPCAGIGDYQSVAPGNENEYGLGNTPPPYYLPALQIVEQPQSVARPSSTEQRTAPAKKPNMVVDLTDGRQIEVSDWWVAGGRFYFVPANAKTGSVDLDTLDLQRTIDENEKRGRTFILNFTAPSERSVLPVQQWNP
jgi:hypothetical protein